MRLIWKCLIVTLLLSISSIHGVEVSDLIKRVIANIVKAIPQFKEELQDSSKRTEVVNKIVQNGFTKFKQQADLQLYRGVEDSNLDAFLKYVQSIINLPEIYQEYFVENLSMVLYSDFNEVVIFRVVFSVDKGGDCKYICVMGQRNDDGKTTDWLVGDVKADFSLAPDVLVIEKSSSYAWGLYQKYESKIISIPKALSQDQLSVVFKFFEICVFERFSELLNIESGKKFLMLN
jgi:hypothetical protein